MTMHKKPKRRSEPPRIPQEEETMTHKCYGEGQSSITVSRAYRVVIEEGEELIVVAENYVEAIQKVVRDRMVNQDGIECVVLLDGDVIQ